MRIVSVGATGGTGKKVVERALAAGHDVVAVARRPEAIPVSHPRLRVAKADVLDPASLTAALTDADAVISTIGPASNKAPGTLLSDGIVNLVAASERAGVRRFVFESGLMLSDGSELGLLSRVGISIFRAMNRALYEDKRKAEATLRESALEWVIVRPPALDDRPARGVYRAGPLLRVSAAGVISHEDAADCLVRAASEPAWVRTIVNVGY